MTVSTGPKISWATWLVRIDVASSVGWVDIRAADWRERRR